MKDTECHEDGIHEGLAKRFFTDTELLSVTDPWMSTCLDAQLLDDALAVKNSVQSKFDE